MRKPEDDLKDDLLEFRSPHIQMSTVESHDASPGIPDIDYCCHGIEGHIELKAVRMTDKIKIRPTQHRWFRDRIMAGGRPFFLVRVKGDEGEFYHFLINGRYHEWLRNQKGKDLVENTPEPLKKKFETSSTPHSLSNRALSLQPLAIRIVSLGYVTEWMRKPDLLP